MEKMHVEAPTAGMWAETVPIMATGMAIALEKGAFEAVVCQQLGQGQGHLQVRDCSQVLVMIVDICGISMPGVPQLLREGTSGYLETARVYRNWRSRCTLLVEES